MPALPPGFSTSRLVALARRSIADVGLDLTSLHVLTEGATGAYGITAIIAALAGAEGVTALVKASRYGSSDDVRSWMTSLAGEAGIQGKLDLVDTLEGQRIAKANIVTNSGHLRPIRSSLLQQLPAKAVVALMFEAWEFRNSDVDLNACRRMQIPIVGINERHTNVDVFGYLGPLCAFHLQKAGIAVYNSRIALICDNDFDRYLLRSLEGAGACVRLYRNATDLACDDWDAIVVSLHPGQSAPLSIKDLKGLVKAAAPSTIIFQFWGDIDRQAAASLGLRVYPPQEPSPGHMGVLLSDIGPEPIIRLQTGGLRAAQQVLSGEPVCSSGYAQILV